MPRRTHEPGVAARAALLAASLLFSLVLGEAVARLVTPFPITETSNKVAHPRLGYVVNSRLPDIDAAGFRNPETDLAEADIVVVGDSHSYGYNVAAEDSFPAVLAEMTHRRVYNMGVGGYGIYHYSVLIDGLSLRPGLKVLLALYPANDLVDHCSITSLPSWQDFARSQGVTAPPCGEKKGRKRKREREPSLSSFLKLHSALIGWLDHAVWDRIKPRSRRADFPQYELPHDQRVAVELLATHARATDLETPEVAQTFENSAILLRRAREKLEAAGVELSVLLVPSRSRVLLEWARRRSFDVPQEFEALVANENRLTLEFLSLLQSQGIAHLDAIDSVVAALDAEVRRGNTLFYPPDEYGHPFEEGYEAYAAAATELLDLQGPP